MDKISNSNVESMYMFNGNKFLPYIDVPIFINRIKKELSIYKEITINKKDETEKIHQGFRTYYEELVAEVPFQKAKIDKIFFEEVIYGELSHVFIHKMNSSAPSTEFFLKRFEKVIEEFQVHIPIATRSAMNSAGIIDEQTKGFYLMDINITKLNGNFLAGFDFTENNGVIETARILIGRNVKRKVKEKKVDLLKDQYLIGAVEINFIDKYFLISHKHTGGIQTEDNEEVENTTYHNCILEKVVSNLGIHPVINHTADKIGMAVYCKILLNKLVEKSRQKMNLDSLYHVDSFIANTASLLNDGKKPYTDTQQEDLKKKIKCLLLGIFIDNNYTKTDLRNEALRLELVGYPTNISYTNSRTDKSSTGTSRADKPIANANTLYSLLSDFEDAQSLKQWSMAWFTNKEELSKTDTIQTTITSCKRYFKIKIKARRNLNKELLHHVVKNLNDQRNYS